MGDGNDTIIHQQVMCLTHVATFMFHRAELGLGNEYFQTSAGQRDRLLTATDRLGKTSDRIQAGRQQLLETEVGGGFSCSGK